MGAKQVDHAAIGAVYDIVKRPAVTFRECAESYIESRRVAWDERHALNWERSIAQHVYPLMGDRPVAELAAPALEFAILTATRSEETLGARKSEIDLEARVWTLPAKRMKGGKEHRIPLSQRAMAIVNGAKGEYLFPGPKPNTPLSHNAMRQLLRHLDVRVTVHGFRSSFRDWAAERTDYPNDIVEMALAHIAGSKVEKAYKRTDLLQKRQALMGDWSRFCGGK